MPSGRLRLLAAAAFLLEVLPLVVAHGHDDSSHGMDMDHTDGAPLPPPGLPSGQLQSYFSYPEHAALAYGHIALMAIGWLVVLPVGVMLSIARSRFALAVQFAFLLVNALGLLVGIAYNGKTPDLYPNNSHHGMGWAVTWIASAWVLMGLVSAYAARCKDAASAGQPVTASAMARYQRLQDPHSPEPTRWSNDSGQGTERNSTSLYGGDLHSPSAESGSQQFPRTHAPDSLAGDDDDFSDEKRGFLRNTAVDRFLMRSVPRGASAQIARAVRASYVVVERVLLILGFVAVATGTVTFGGIARGDAVFNILAHYIKGGIFFGYGVLTLGRWMGCFADFGWAWNVKPSRDVVGRWRAAVPTAEFTESFVIWLYGASNVFLEHLAAWGGEWTAQDLEHVSISVMFFGGGLLGMLIESKRVRGLLNTTILLSKETALPGGAWEPPRSYSFSLNPLPALIIMLLGMMMSSHHQASMLSAMVHKQWGNMFVGFALARGVTYVVLYLSPPTSLLPSRPPTELVASFCLMVGGLTFMISNKDTVDAMERHGLDSMFTFVVTVGSTALFMAWVVFLVAVKGWAVRRENASTFLKRSAGAAA